MLSGISFTCFAASYAVGLVLEWGRFFYQLGRKPWLVVAFAFAGFFAHSYYLVARMQEALATRGLPLSNWYNWCVLAAWLLALIYVLLVTFRTDNTFGIFLLPLILVLLGIAQTFPSDQVFSSGQSTRAWGVIHGIGLMLGTVSVAMGFASGLMYLLQSYRLKHKIASRRGLRLPSLEWLRSANERCLVWSTFLLSMGIFAGVMLNLATGQPTARAISWSNPIVWLSGVLLLWLVFSIAFISFYKPARVGRKVAYLTITSFLMLAITLSFIVGSSDHGVTDQSQNTVHGSTAAPGFEDVEP